MESISIKTAFNRCKKQFQDMIASGLLKATESEVSIDKWKDELGRMGIWAYDVGLHRKYQRSLEYKLRDDSDTEKHVVSVLRFLQDTLDDVEEAIKNPAPKDARASLDKEFGLTEVQQYWESIGDAIGCLNKCARTLVDTFPLCEDRIRGTLQQDVSPFREADERHVSDKFLALRVSW